MVKTAPYSAYYIVHKDPRHSLYVVSRKYEPTKAMALLLSGTVLFCSAVKSNSNYVATAINKSRGHK